MIDTTTYTALVTSEHNRRQRFIAMLELLVSQPVDAQNILTSFNMLFDIDVAVGQQLDFIGQWIGQSRNIKTPLEGVFFSWDIAGVGWDEGVWFGPGDSTNGLTTLDDASYRLVLQAKIAANHWDGTVPSAYAIWNIVFALEGIQILIQDNQDMTMSIVLLSQSASAILVSLLVNEYLTVRPAGVRIDGFFQPSVEGVPLFGFDVENSTISGWDVGAWAEVLAPASYGAGGYGEGGYGG